MLHTSGNNTDANILYEKSLKKYKYSKKVWLSYLTYKLKIQQYDEAKALLTRAIQSLGRHKHIFLLEQYGLSEYEYGSADRGRIIFENLINTYPNRIDLWHVYVDREVKMGNIIQARQLYNRMITLKTSSNYLKTIFKKYLNFEVEHGSVETQLKVKQKAREYVNSLTA